MDERTKKYSLTVQWTGNKGLGTSSYKGYDRSHTIQADHKVDILGSSDSVYLGDPHKYNPEELLVAAVSSCHMLWYLHLCAEAGVVVMDYLDNPVGILQVTADGGGHFKEVILHPIITVNSSSIVDQANKLHKKANQLCFIANSVNFKVDHFPVYKVLEP